MDRLILATAAIDMPAPRALERIRQGTSALVVVGRSRPGIIQAYDVVDAINEAVEAGGESQDVRIGDVAPLSGLLSEEIPPLVGGLETLYPTVEERAVFERLFSRYDGQFLIQRMDALTAVVVTASERLGAVLNASVTICKCAGTPPHYFRPNQVRVPGRCNYPHGAAVTCSAVGG